MISKNVGNIISSVKVPDMMLTVILAEPMLTVILMIMILKTIGQCRDQDFKPYFNLGLNFHLITIFRPDIKIAGTTRYDTNVADMMAQNG